MKQTDRIIQSKLKDHEVDVPSGLWEEIERRLPRQKPSVPVWKKYARYAAAAAFVSACFLSGYLLLSPDTPESIVARQTATSGTSTSAQPQSADNQRSEKGNTDTAATGETAGPAIKAGQTNQAIRLADDTRAILADTESRTANGALSPQQGYSQDRMANYPKADKRETTSDVAEEETASNPKQDRENSTSDGNPANETAAPATHLRHAASGSNTLYASNSTFRHNQTDARSTSYALSISSTNAISTTQYAQDTRMTRSSLYYAAESSILKYQHKVPISIGITFEKQFGAHWGIESGLVYTLLRSDYKTETLQRKGKQELHYLGIPLLARYRFFNTKLFSFYVSAGPQMDFNIYGRRTDDTYSQLAYSTYTENIRDRRVQWSAHLKLGVSYIISRHFDLYAEPAVAYFFDNGNKNIENLWKDKPVNFAFHLGFRTKF